jgi:TonB-linked SusC/RagA family outer membrane protein
MSIRLLKSDLSGTGLRSLLMLVAFTLMITGAAAQSQTVSGIVTDGTNPIPGVSILEKGTSRGTATDADGKFSIVVESPTGTLIFSFIGYKTVEVPVNTQSTINVALAEDVQSLQEVVVTALGVKREVKSLGYAVQSVDGATSTKAREPNIINSLTGKVAGLVIKNQTDLFQSPVIQLRGATPLIVIDGVPSVDADFWKINADDIDTYTVLKGATASALYGSIGRNGAIMITTKRGSQSRTTVEINSSTMFQTGFIRIPNVQSTYGNGNNGQYAYSDGSGGGLEGGGWIWGPKLDQPDPTTPSGYWETTQFNSPRDPDTGELIPTPFLSRGANNVKNFFQTGILSTNNISVSAGNDQGNFRVSVANTYQKGIVPNTDLNNTSFSVSGGYKFAKNFKADASLSYNKQYTDNFPEVGYGPTNYLYNLVLWTGPDVDVRDQRNYWVEGQEGVQQRNYNRSWYNNPYFQAYEYLQGYNKNNVFGQVKLEYNVLPGLDLMIRTGINQYGLERSWKEPKSYVAYDYISNGNLFLANENELNLNTDFIASYTKQFNENFSIRASAGGANRWRTFSRSDQRTDGLVIPGFYNLSNSASPLKGSNRVEQELVYSAYGTVDVEVFGGIFLGVTGRNDWVSTLSPGNNSFFYPSVSLAGVVTDFVDLSTAKISFLKFRGSISRVGAGKIGTSQLNSQLGSNYPYKHVQAYNPGVNWNGTPSLNFPSVLIPPGIVPETSDTYEAGMDVRFLEGRAGLDAAIYRVRDFNNIIERPLSSASGYTSVLENGGEFLRKGVEITITATPVKMQRLSWDLTFNWSRAHRYQQSDFGSSDLQIKKGDRTDEINWYQYAHTPGGKLILNQNGFPLDDPYPRLLGYSDPNHIFGLQNTLKYGNFALNFSFDGRSGGVMYSTTNQKMWWGGTHPGTVNQYRDDANAGIASYVAPGVIVADGQVQYDLNGNIISDTRTYAPNVTAVNYIAWNVNTSNGFLNHYYSQSFVKLREVSLTFNVPQSILGKGFQKASISLVGRNLILWAKIPEVDPDSGRDDLQTPSTRNIGFNINVAF